MIPLMANPSDYYHGSCQVAMTVDMVVAMTVAMVVAMPSSSMTELQYKEIQ